MKIFEIKTDDNYIHHVDFNDFIDGVNTINKEYLSNLKLNDRVVNKLKELNKYLYYINIEEYLKRYDLNDYESLFKLEDDINELIKTENKILSYKLFNIVVDSVVFNDNITPSDLEAYLIKVVEEEYINYDIITENYEVCEVYDIEEDVIDDEITAISFYFHINPIVYEECLNKLQGWIKYTNLEKYILNGSRYEILLPFNSYKNFRV